MTLALLTVVMMLAASPAEQALADAKAARTELKGDAQRKKFRHNWQNVGKKLEAAAQKLGSGPKAVEALTLAAQTYEELSKFSGNKEDSETAEKLFKKAKELDGAEAKKGEAPPKKKPEGESSSKKAVAAKDAPKDAPKGEASKPAVAKTEAAKASAKGEAGKAEAPKTAKADAKKLINHPDDEEDGKPSSKAEQQLGRIAEAFKKIDVPEVAGRRQAPSRPSVAAAADAEPAGAELPDTEEPKGMHLPSIEEIQERLRDVRVGQREVQALKQSAKDSKNAELTLAEQLGLKVKRVIIDAGHGGHDTGAIGKGGTLEKDVSLSIALKLAKKLKDEGLEVLLTRDDDTFVPLEGRTRFANQHKGDLFISVHCNSAVSRDLRGVETYTLNTSSDRYSIRLAARENASTERGVGDLQLILADLATKANTEESGRLARRVQREMVSSLKGKNPAVRDLGHKEALFFVLLGAKMPAILVETSFLSNPVEEKLLGSEGYQDDAAEAIAEGVRGFLEERSRVAQVD
jgi:N-acetylmuramoyl-L-alanine amidase